MDIQEALAKNIRKLRSRLDLSQEELSEISGVPIGTIQSAEYKKNWPGIKNINKIAKSLKCTNTELFEVERVPTPKEALKVLNNYFEKTDNDDRIINKIERLNTKELKDVEFVIDNILKKKVVRTEKEG
jgi:transcriptional regulator with XRE-family HTH domain